MLKVLFVCMGNYCRSPTAQGIAEKIIKDKRLETICTIGSAGTHRDHVGSPSDPRAVATAQLYEVPLEHIRSRQITLQDFYTWDYIIAMDDKNMRTLQAQCPIEMQHKISLLMSHAKPPKFINVPDPYWRSAGFEAVFLMIYEGVAAFMEEII